jgi:aminopeptidase-like protein
LFLPGTIGSITWLAHNKEQVHRVKHGLVLSCLGDAGPMTYKASRRGNAQIDRYAAHVLTQRGGCGRLLPFTPYGYDERQYCSPGFDMPIGCLMRSPNGTFPEYHTSADNLDFVRPEWLADSLDHLQRIVDIIEDDRIYLGTNPYCEPQLGRRGLYRAMDEERRRPAGTGARFDQMTLLWVLNLADGGHSLFDMAIRSGEPFDRIKAAAAALLEAKLLVLADDARPHLTVAPPPDLGARRSC